MTGEGTWLAGGAVALPDFSLLLDGEADFTSLVHDQAVRWWLSSLSPS